jgi:hypothetical protein
MELLFSQLLMDFLEHLRLLKDTEAPNLIRLDMQHLIPLYFIIQIIQANKLYFIMII